MLGLRRILLCMAGLFHRLRLTPHILSGLTFLATVLSASGRRLLGAWRHSSPRTTSSDIPIPCSEQATFSVMSPWASKHHVQISRTLVTGFGHAQPTSVSTLRFPFRSSDFLRLKGLSFSTGIIDSPRSSSSDPNLDSGSTFGLHRPMRPNKTMKLTATAVRLEKMIYLFSPRIGLSPSGRNLSCSR